MNELQRLKELIAEANQTNSTNDKKAVVSKYPGLKEIFRYTLDETIQFGVTTENIKKKTDIDPVLAKDYDTVFQLLEALSTRAITGHTAIASVQEFIKKSADYEDEIFNIIDKNLKIRISETIINKIWPGCVPTFDVALADKYHEKKKKVNFEKDAWYKSTKLDGCLEASSEVQFEDGSKKTIKEIVDNRLEGKVKSFNTKTNNVEFKKILNWSKNLEDISEKSKTIWYELETESGEKLKLTGNHRVWCQDLKCWRRVDELDGTEILLTN